MDKKKILVWCIIIIVLFLVPAIFMKQFFDLQNMVTIPTINFGEIRMPGLIAGGIGFWGFVLIIWGIGNMFYKVGKFIINKCIKKRTAS